MKRNSEIALEQALTDCGVQPGQILLSAVSGGADSMALLHLLHRTVPQKQLVAAHFHHGIRGESADADAKLVRDCCRAWGIPLLWRQGDVPRLSRERGMGLEEAARTARYAFLEEARRLCGASWIVTAHHGDDQAETVLLHLLRGSGLNGLAGMRSVRGRVIRPLLGVSKETLLAYVQENAVPYREDESNASADYTRNRVRQELLPLLKTYNPAVTETLGRMARSLSGDEDYLTGLAREALTAARGESGWDADRLNRLPEPIRLRTARLLLYEQGLYDLTENDLLRLCALYPARTGAAWEKAGRVFRMEYGILTVSRKESLPTVCLPFRTGEPLCVFDGCYCAAYENRHPWNRDRNIAFLDGDRLPRDLCIRTRLPGDRIFPLGSPGQKKLKDYFIDEKIPRSQRQGTMLCAGERVIFLPGRTIDHDCRVTEETTRLLRVTFRPRGKEQEERE